VFVYCTWILKISITKLVFIFFLWNSQILKQPRWAQKRYDILTFLVRNEMFVRKYSANHIKQKVQLRFHDLKSLNNLDPSPRFPLRNLLKYIYTGVINSFLINFYHFNALFPCRQAWNLCFIVVGCWDAGGSVADSSAGCC